MTMPPDDTGDLFGEAKPAARLPPVFARDLQPRLAAMAAHGLYVGTSSRKYPGWCGNIYDEKRYLTKGRFSETGKFNPECLSEYAQTFQSVCVDAGYYRFPTEDYIGGMAAQVLDGFEFAFKVTDEITIKRFPNLPKHGERRGMENPNFLNAEMFTRLSRSMRTLQGQGRTVDLRVLDFQPKEFRAWA